MAAAESAQSSSSSDALSTMPPPPPASLLPRLPAAQPAAVRRITHRHENFVEETQQKQLERSMKKVNLMIVPTWQEHLPATVDTHSAG